MIRLALVSLAASGIFGFSVFAQQATGMKLEDAGFKMSEANTPGKLAQLKAIPPHRFVRRARKGVPYYVYADPDYCRCAYVGTQQAMDTYRGMGAPITGLPGYRGPIDTSRPSGANVTNEMIHDMGEDGTDPQFEDDMFNTGLTITVPLQKSP